VSDIISDEPPKKKSKTSTSTNLAAQTTHNVEQDGYGKHMHPTTSIHLTSWPTTVSGKIIRTTWCDLDFSKGDEKKPYMVPYTFFHFWTGTDVKSSNNSIINYQTCIPLAIGAQYHSFKLTITNQATTRKRLLTQGTTNTITHDFETSQNLLIFWDNIRTRNVDVNIYDVINPPWFKGPDDIQAGDCPWSLEELATGHTKTITFMPSNPPPPNFFEPINLSNTSTHLGKLIPGCQRSAQMSFDTPINQDKYLSTYNYRHTSIEHTTNRPALFLDQPHILAESGIMKFIYRLYITFEIDYTLFLKSYELQDKNYQRFIVPLSQLWKDEKTSLYKSIHTPNLGPI
jgi:hypothetical protein